ncbi:MAG: branched-chain amino acid ABC transporter permease [Leucobacter sp.]|nr:branched-chain amino acid ABC transporter permease [Leucobacter sp.]
MNQTINETRPVARAWSFLRAHPALLIIPWGLALFFLPMVLGPRWTDIATLIFIATVGSVALNMVTGTAGQMSLGNAALMAVGAYTAAGITFYIPNVPFLLVLVFSALVAGVVGLLVGIPALRLAGLYLVMATLALHFIVKFVAEKFQLATVGVAGFLLPRPEIFGIRLDEGNNWIYFTGILATLALLGYRNLLRSRFGRAWLGIHYCEQAAEALGVNVSRYKFIVFGLSSAIIGVQGAVFGYYLYGVEIDSFPLSLAISYVAMIIIGGLGRPLGSFLGAIFVVGLPYTEQDLVGKLPNDSPIVGAISNQMFNIQLGLYGLAVVVFLVIEPTGLRGLITRVANMFRAGAKKRNTVELKETA